MAPSCHHLLILSVEHQILELLGESSSSSILLDSEDPEVKLPLSGEDLELQKGRVRFLERNSVSEIPSRSDLSLEELQAVWMIEEDYAKILNKINITKAAMNSNSAQQLAVDVLLCSRGLNNLDSLYARAESSAIVQGLILQQTAHQVTQEGTWDEIMVAKIYRDCSQPALLKLQSIARNDAEDSIRYLFET